MPFFVKELKYALVISTCSMSIGFILAYCSPAAASLYSHFEFNSFQQSAFNAIPNIAAVIGSPLASLFVGKIGRKFSVIILQGSVTIGWILLAITGKSYFWLGFIARVICGLGMGGILGVVPVYIDELAPKDAKNSYGVLNMLFLSCGTLLSYTYGFTNNWRWIACLSLLPCLIFFIFIWFCPDTTPFKPENNEKGEKSGQFKELFQKENVKSIITAALSVVFQQFSGINALLTNLSPIFEESKIPISSTVASIIVAAAQFVATLSASSLVGIFGNKVCWIASSLGQAICLFIIWAHELFNIGSIVPFICLFLDVLMFGLGVGPIPMFVIVLLFPPELSSLASSLTQGLNYLLSSTMIFSFNEMVATMTIGWVYFFYAVVMIASVIYGFTLLPSGKEPFDEEIDEIDEDDSKFDSL